MTDRPDGDQAFPGLSKEYNAFGDPILHPGMTLRQWYKGQALTAMGPTLQLNPDNIDGDMLGAARLCGRMADAQIAEDELFEGEGG